MSLRSRVRFSAGSPQNEKRVRGTGWDTVLGPVAPFFRCLKSVFVTQSEMLFDGGLNLVIDSVRSSLSPLIHEELVRMF